MPKTIKVRATRPEYRILAHPVGGRLDAETGEGDWPADGFTFRLEGEKAIERVRPAPAAAPAVGDPPSAPHPLDHDGSGRKGGSLKGRGSVHRPADPAP